MLALGHSSLQGCPAYLEARKLPYSIGKPKGSVVLLRYSRSEKKLIRVPVQIETKTLLGRHIFPNLKASNKIVYRDRIILDPVYSGDRLTDLKRVKPICEVRKVFEVKYDVSTTFNYLVFCKASSENNVYAPTVKIDVKNRNISSFHYNYNYDSENHMLFDSVKLRNEKQAVASDSRLVIGTDVKNFIDLVFDSEDMLSRLEVTEERPVGLAARVTFFLKILFFKIQMDLRTDLSFFSNSAHIPMVATTPVNAFDYVHPGSGIVYLWKSSFHTSGVLMPEYKEKDVAKTVGKYCRGRSCFFGVSYRGAKGKDFSLNFVLKKDLVEKGFYPRWISPEQKMDDLVWSKSIEKEKGEQGVYFETSLLPKGSHRWNFWLNIGDAQPGTCPTLIQLDELTLN